jgi:hypothetical protein
MQKNSLNRGAIFWLIAGLLFLGGCFFFNTPSLDGVDIYEGYALTRYAYQDSDDLDAAVRDEFGVGAEVADWDDIEVQFAGRIAEFLDGVGVAYVGDPAVDHVREIAFIYRGGSRYWDGNRQYFMARHNGVTPSHFLVHATIDSNMLDLGSWYGFSAHILVKLP